MYNILEMTALQKWRTDWWLPEDKEGVKVGGTVDVALKEQREGFLW